MQGQIGAGAQDVPAVEWTPGPAGGGRPRFGLIANSLLSGDSAVIGADLDGGLLELRNCILASAADGLDIRVTGSAGPDGHLVVSDCTLSCPGTFLRAETGVSPGGSRLHVYVDHTVFGPSIGTGQGGPSIVTHPAGADSSGRLVWWEERTAYDRRINRYRRIAGETDDAAQDFSADWIRAWGPEHVAEALTDPTAVLLATSLPAPERATPESFVLAPNCGAAQYRPGGGPIGARVEAIGPGALSAPSAATPQQTPRPNTPRSNQPDF